MAFENLYALVCVCSRVVFMRGKNENSRYSESIDRFLNKLPFMWKEEIPQRFLIMGWCWFRRRYGRSKHTIVIRWEFSSLLGHVDKLRNAETRILDPPFPFITLLYIEFMENNIIASHHLIALRNVWTNPCVNVLHIPYDNPRSGGCLLEQHVRWAYHDRGPRNHQHRVLEVLPIQRRAKLCVSVCLFAMGGLTEVCLKRTGGHFTHVALD